MRRLFLGMMLLFAVQAVIGQSSKHALGLRFGGGDGMGSEISYQYGISESNRLEFDLGTHSSNLYNAWGLAGIYQWTWNIDKGFQWYAGAGGRIGSWNWDASKYLGSNKSGMFLSAVGNVGIEYTFPFRLQLSLDARPEVGLISHGDALSNTVALSARYRF